jgi:hypothetical protein
MPTFLCIQDKLRRKFDEMCGKGLLTQAFVTFVHGEAPGVFVGSTR